MIDATVETFDQLVREGQVLVDIWGPQCRPCLTLMPAVESLAETYGDNVRFVKVNAPENRKICRDLRVAGLPAYLTMRDGVEATPRSDSETLPRVSESRNTSSA